MHEKPGIWDRYRISLRTAEFAFRKLGRNSIDGKETHDIAMHSLFSPAWSVHRVRLDVIDAYRKERGRRARTGEPLRRKFQQIPSDLATRDPPHHPDDWMNAWTMTEAEKRVAVLIAAGFTKTETAKWLGITQTAVWDALRRIGQRKENCKGERQ